MQQWYIQHHVANKAVSPIPILILLLNIFNLNLKSTTIEVLFYFILFYFYSLKDNKMQLVMAFILSLLYYLNNMHSLTLTLIKKTLTRKLCYINIKTMTHPTWSSSHPFCPLTESKFHRFINQTLTHTKQIFFCLYQNLDSASGEV
jgi:hypothetical protein